MPTFLPTLAQLARDLRVAYDVSFVTGTTVCRLANLHQIIKAIQKSDAILLRLTLSKQPQFIAWCEIYQKWQCAVGLPQTLLYPIKVWISNLSQDLHQVNHSFLNLPNMSLLQRSLP